MWNPKKSGGSDDNDKALMSMSVVDTKTSTETATFLAKMKNKMKKFLLVKLSENFTFKLNFTG